MKEHFSLLTISFSRQSSWWRIIKETRFCALRGAAFSINEGSALSRTARFYAHTRTPEEGLSSISAQKSSGCIITRFLFKRDFLCADRAAAQPPINAFRDRSKDPAYISAENGLKRAPFAVAFYNVCGHR